MLNNLTKYFRYYTLLRDINVNKTRKCINSLVTYAKSIESKTTFHRFLTRGFHLQIKVMDS